MAHLGIPTRGGTCGAGGHFAKHKSNVSINTKGKRKMVDALNFKPFSGNGSIAGFFDLRYHGLTIKGCKLMNGTNGHWVALPQKEGTDKEGNKAYFELMQLTKAEAEHVRKLVILNLQQQGYCRDNGPPPPRQQKPNNGFKPPDTGEDLNDYLPPPGDIPW